MTKEIRYYFIGNKSPYLQWFESLDSATQLRIGKRLERLTEGHFGDYKKITAEISELRFHFGAGYRVYFTEIGNTIVMLLNGGDKSRQADDIEKAKRYANDFKSKSKEIL